MQADKQDHAQDPTNRTEKKLQEKSDRFTWWQSLLILVVTLAVCLGGGYFVSSKYLWNNQTDQLEKQLNYYQAQVDKNPNDPKMRIQLGYIYFLKHDFANAAKQYQTAKDLDKNNYDAYLNLSIVYDQEGRYDDALQNAVAAVKLSPQDYKALLLEGRIYRQLKMYKQADNALQNAIRFQPGNVDIIYEAGLVAEAEGNLSAAEKIYKEALSYDPTFKPAENRLQHINANNKK